MTMTLLAQMISMDKQYRTRDGREVRIYAVDGGSHAPVHGAYLDARSEWTLCNWLADGHFASGVPVYEKDLIEVKPKITRTYWLAHFQSGTQAACRSADETRDMLRAYRSTVIAITGPHQVEFTEGDGLGLPQ